MESEVGQVEGELLVAPLWGSQTGKSFWSGDLLLSSSRCLLQRQIRNVFIVVVAIPVMKLQDLDKMHKEHARVMGIGSEDRGFVLIL